MDHVGCLSLGDSHTFCKKVSCWCKENDYAQNLIFFLVGFSWGFSAKVKMAVFAFLQLVFSHKYSLDKSRWQGSWTTIARIHFLHFLTGFFWKVAMTRILDDCSDAFSAFSHKDAHEFPLYRNVFSPFLFNNSFRKELHTSSNMNHVSIEVAVVDLI